MLLAVTTAQVLSIQLNGMNLKLTNGLSSQTCSLDVLPLEHRSWNVSTWNEDYFKHLSDR